MPFLTLQDVSRQNNQIQETCQLLSTKFLSIYGHEPVAFAYAPGRVNLIGEHIDYEGYSVLPMALDRYFVLIAISLPLPPVNMENRSSSPDNGRYADEDNAGVVRVSHLDSEKFTSSSFSTNPTIPVQRENQHWTNYVHCGYKGAWLLHDPPKDSTDTDSIENDQETDAETARITETISGQPLNLLVTGNVPLASGLSSSSALVVASVLASLYGRRILTEASSSSPSSSSPSPSPSPSSSSSSSLSNKTTIHNLSGEQIADICRRAEQYIGTMGGGMDQTISCLGHAQLIQFHQSKPPTSTKVVLPPKSTFVVAESTTPSPKAETVNQRYNKRVVECMLASKVLGKKLGISHYLHLTTLQQVQHQVQNNGSKSNTNDKNGMPSLCEMEQLVLSNLKSTPYTLDEILKELNVSNHHHENEKGKEWLCAFPHFRLEDEAEDDSKRWLSMIGNVIDEASIQGYSLQARAQHVYSEAQRVLDFHQLCCTFQQQQQQQLQDSGSNLSATITENEVLKQLGDIMNESHTSCRDLYECSSKELDELTNKCRNYRSDCHGVSACYGSRLTGAGWGGSTVSLVVSDDYAASFIERLLERQKRDRVNNNIPPDSNMYCKRVFTCKPGQGAFLMEY